MITSSYPFQPPVYFCQKRKKDFHLDGNIHKDFWKEVAFTSDFIDIEGPEHRPTPRFRTRAKMQWDEENIYFAALLEGDEIWANVTQRDEVIFQDNDFEIFIDPTSTTQRYIEFEMNALNTIWDLLLTKSYKDDGKAINSFDIKGLQSAVYIDGKLNKADAENRFWSVEVVIPFESVIEVHGKSPQLGDYWRVNFSRVQWEVDRVDGTFVKKTKEDGTPLPEDNWVWAATGIVDIHHPQYWGFVFFTNEAETYEIPEVERYRFELYQIYYAQRQYFDDHQVFAKDLATLQIDFPYENQLTMETTKNSFELRMDINGTEELLLFQDGYSEIRNKK